MDVFIRIVVLLCIVVAVGIVLVGASVLAVAINGRRRRRLRG